MTKQRYKKKIIFKIQVEQNINSRIQMKHCAFSVRGDAEWQHKRNTQATIRS
jgi:hypothetical protein